MTPEVKAQQEKEMIENCKNKEKATDDDVKTVSSREVPQTATGKCLVACLQETMGVVRFVLFTVFQSFEPQILY